jgi:hypothetical protein
MPRLPQDIVAAFGGIGRASDPIPWKEVEVTDLPFFDQPMLRKIRSVSSHET